MPVVITTKQTIPVAGGGVSGITAAIEAADWCKPAKNATGWYEDYRLRGAPDQLSVW